MESPRAGIILLALVAVTTASGTFLGWTMRPQASPLKVARPVSESPVGVPGAAIETLSATEPISEKRPTSGL
jgi:hypothetical protein